MSNKPWFHDPRAGILPMPISIEGWISLAAFVALLLATGLSHSALMWPLRIALGGGYFVLSLAKSDRAR
ncbi:hypothetical protein [Sphingomonas sp. MMS24-J13]|uniref:hypothetical protein n=1 Tax=Sphingomonas sp. MMS24-J13 TaxID=3238686 RepID=UPI00384AC388